MGAMEKTMELMQGSLKPDPDNFYWRGRIYYAMCHPRDKSKSLSAEELTRTYQMASRDFTKAIWNDSKYAEGYCRRGWVNFEMGNYDLAVEDCKKALQLNKNLADAHYNLARIYSMAADPKYLNGKLAWEHARVACQITKSKSWYCLAAASAAKAELGDFANAQKIQQMAIKIAPEYEQRNLAERLALFRQQKPFRHRAPASTASKSGSGTLTTAN
jgi:tetratricopeptide (TPR) repeat protein